MYGLHVIPLIEGLYVRCMLEGPLRFLQVAAWILRGSLWLVVCQTARLAGLLILLRCRHKILKTDLRGEERPVHEADPCAQTSGLRSQMELLT